MVSKKGENVKKTIVPTSITLSMRPDGGASISLSTKPDDLEVVLSAEQWRGLGEAATWFKGQVIAEAPAKPTKRAGLAGAINLIDVHDRLCTLENAFAARWAK